MTEVFNLLAQEPKKRARIRRGGWAWGPVDTAKLRVLSLGAGVQSTTLALMAAHGEIGPMPDLAIFADTGDESEATMETLAWLASGNVLPFPVVHVRGPGRLSDAILSRSSDRGTDFQPVPFYTDRGIGKRQCTSHWKIEPINRELRLRLGYRPRQRIPESSVEVWIGVSTDEVVRAGAAHEKWIVNRYPLLESRMSRQGCVAWLVRHGYPVPRNSACVYCPFIDDVDRRVQRDHAPAEFERACVIDRALRAPGRKAEYVHPSRKPLEEVDLSTPEERGQGNMLMLCDAGCGL
ncbi:hypothetical protein CN155_04800 [Sinorhizobium meliloti]|uniref:hypothetical protein n=1 Tax=Rhizobium meliloti TaxID=382 RepID=UPI000FDC3F76|nr:hypothetical protein [Sinorhizobium meliloti]RVK60581.1 hypothetical protein CN155_04800 [Sinorhizobium meliloti]